MSAGPIGKSLGLTSALKAEEDQPNKVIISTTEKQGIVSIISSDTNCQQTKSPASLRMRRTLSLSADMSSKKWLAMKKVASSEELAIKSQSAANSSASSSSLSSEDEGGEQERLGQDDVWRSIQFQSHQKKELEKASGKFDWSSILLSNKKANEAEDAADSSKSLSSAPYVHPLVMKRASSLSEKSLQVCTESLGSETGSEGFSSYPASETGSADEDRENKEQQQEEEQLQRESRAIDAEEMRAVVKANCSAYKKSSVTSFPPPLSSLARCDGPSLHVHSHRQNGRLVLEAVSTPSQNYFRAHRQDGRLLLTFAETTPSLEQNHEQLEGEEVEDEMFANFEEEKGSDQAEETETIEEEEQEGDEEEEEDEDVAEKEDTIRIVMEEAVPKFSSGIINFHRSALMMKKKLMRLDNRNPKWTKFNTKAVNYFSDMEAAAEEDKAPAAVPIAQSLPRVARLVPSPPATAAAAASFNSYDYFWRAQPLRVAATLINPVKNHCYYNEKVPVTPKNNLHHTQEQEMVLLRGNKADYLFPLVNRGCKEPRRSLLMREPHCIATS